MPFAIDFKIIRDQIPIEAVLAHYGVRLRTSSRSGLRGQCPLPTHSSRTSVESFSVHTGKNVWACQSDSCASNRGGKKGGGVIDFVASMEQCSIRDAGQKLHRWFMASGQSTPIGRDPAVVRPKLEPSIVDEAPNKPLRFALKNIDSNHPYLLQRGLSIETSRHFGVGLYSGRGSMSGKMVIPITNSTGQLVAYAGRTIDGSQPKYKFPAGFRKSLELFNLGRVLRIRQKLDAPIIVVEGFFDCMKVYQAGFPHVVALMGSSMSDRQEAQLIQFERAVVLLDGDDAGQRAANIAANRLMRHIFVKVVSLSDGKQPDQCPSEEIRAILEA